ncbi:FG-GAP-like repeat-containing protein [Nocardioides sp. GCM10027113]|uniref:FG-GAP-like repeat-containing protein n=1 Tax=unclassified Nocardioides TaxID=2615069 RepID=UPI003618F405
MRPSKARFVTACQQVLALGVVLAVLTPAATVISLDVVRQAPLPGAHQAVTNPSATLSAYGREASRSSLVPTAPVDAEVTEIELTAPAAGAAAGRRVAPQPTARAKMSPLERGTKLMTVPVPVEGYAGVGLTWDPEVEVDDHDLTFAVRTRQDGAWSSWTEVEYHDEHGPDPDSVEARNARPGTDLVLVGEVDELQVRGVAEQGPMPAGLRMAVTEPGEAPATTREKPELAAEATVTRSAPGAGDTGTDPGTDTSDAALDLQAASYTPKPVIYSRAQWGANENLRNKSALSYYEVHAGFVHHTVNANDYSRAEVPGILRSIYAYHTQSRGWSDVGYNFLVDKFGRIWEGRYGGIDRPVVGAHTLGYNEYSFAMSAIGNFDVRRPPAAMLQAYGSLMAWKLSLHGVSATDSSQQVGTRTFPAINGHRDAGTTACPGRYLYAELGTIRQLASAAQKGWDGRELESDLAGSAHPDLIVRDKASKEAYIVPTRGLLAFRKPTKLDGYLAGSDLVVASPDLTGDGTADLLVRGTDGTATVRPGTGSGFGDAVQSTRMFEGRDLVTAVGDLDGDGRHDLVARNTDSNALNVFLGRGDGSFSRNGAGGDWSGYDLLVGAGDVDGDGLADLMARDRQGLLWRFPGDGNGGFGAAVAVPGAWSDYDQITGYGDFDGVRGGDLVVRVAGGKGYVLPGRGDGTFGKRLGPIGRLKRGTQLSGAGNLVDQGAPDVVMRRGSDLLLVPHRGTYDTGEPIATGMRLGGVNALLSAGDWDRDGLGDVIVRKVKNGNLVLRRGNGEGGFESGTRLARGFGNVSLLAAVGDMTGDGWPDLMGQPAGGSMRIYPGRGADGIGESYAAYSRIDATSQIGIGRWDEDGAPDSLLRKGSGVTLYVGNGPGGLRSPKNLGVDLSSYDWVIGTSSLTMRGRSSLVVRHRTTGDLYVLQRNASGFKPRRLIGEGMSAYDLAG